MQTRQRAARLGAGLAAAVWFSSTWIVPPVLALDTTLKSTQFIYRDWTRADGLPSDVIWNLAYGRSGYLWLATEGGLARFDGVRFEVFNSETRSGFRVNDVRDVVEDADGNAWAATYGGGVVRVSGNAVSRFGEAHGLDSEIVYSLAAARDGAVWVGTSVGVCQKKLAEALFRCWGESDGLPVGRYLRAEEADDGAMWFSGLGNGVVRFHEDGFRVFSVEDGLDGPQIFALANDPGYGMFLATYSGAMYYGTETGIEPVEDYGLGTGDVIWDATRDRAGTLWVALNSGGVRSVEDDSYQLERGSFATATVLSLVPGDDDDLWIGTDEGLRHVRRGTALPYGELEGISNGTFVVAAGDDNAVWIGAESDGLFRVAANGRVDRWTETEGLPASSVSALLQAADGSLWVGTFGGGLAHLSQAGAVTDIVNKEHGLGSNQIISLFEDVDASLWVGTAGGLHRIENGEVVQTITSDDGLPTNLVRHIGSDDRGSLWLSTEGGLAVFDLQQNQIVRRLAAGSGLQSSVIVTTYTDASGAVWVGSRVDGLARIDGDQFFVFTAEHGINLRSIMGIAEDQTGGLWLVGRDGAMRADKASLVAVAQGLQDRVESRVLSEQDGLRSVRVPGGYQSPIAVLDNGDVWLATARGAVKIDPARLEEIETSQPLLIESVVVDGVTFGVDEVTELPPDTKALQIHYSVPDLIAAERLRFRYRIRGGDQEWQVAGTRRTAFFTDPRPGRTVFEVQVTTDGNPFRDSPDRMDSLDFTVTPRWYQRRVVRWAAFSLTLILVGLLYRRLVRGYRSRQQTLEGKLEERTANLQKALQAADKATARDALTRLANRRTFGRHLEAAWSKAREKDGALSLLLLSVDDFGDYNEFAGMTAGDALLRQIADRLAEQLRQGDRIARVGDAEFAIVFDDSNHSTLAVMAQRMQSSIGALEIQHKGRPKGSHVTMSAGFVSVSATALAETDAIVRRANQALRRAKESGRDQAVVDIAAPALAG